MASLNEYYNQFLNDLAAKYQGQIDVETENYNASKNDLKNTFDMNKELLGKSREQAMRSAYISQQKAMRDVPAALASQGIKGGLTESTYGNLLKTYQNARGNATSSYNEQIGKLGQDYQSNLTNLNNSYRTNINNINAAKETDAWGRANDSWSAYLQEEAERRAAEQWELEKQERERAASSGGGSGRSGRSIKGKKSEDSLEELREQDKKLASTGGYYASQPQVVDKKRIPTGQIAYIWSDGKVTYSAKR
ncbi:hypothetical protein [Christensenella tenuis]|uniref:Uncharacterized protein n=1 Tax=Christensenella tenuis TaxID=2763033 RepID=A0ABR7EGF1_9FIRM|nr:hypothetical protein [Christensenella tenuis]MBC5648253.1 hypothetical protein [Christensenella tenuis]